MKISEDGDVVYIAELKSRSRGTLIETLTIKEIVIVKKIS